MNRSKGPAWLTHRIENWMTAAGLCLMALFPLIEICSRILGIVGLVGTTDYVRHLTLWVGFLGAMLAARENRHLSLHAGVDFLPDRPRRIIRIGTAALATAVCGSLAWAGFEFVRSEYSSPAMIAGWIPQWTAIVIMPISFGFVALRLIWHASDHWSGRTIAATGLIFATGVGFLCAPMQVADLLVPAIILLIAAGILGSPIFAIIGGVALLLFFAQEIPAAAIPVEAYRIVASPILPSVPLFTLAGYILAEGGASRRLIRLFRALLGWMPGGVAVATACVCTFFTTFTGASGVTILALGAILLPVLIQNGFNNRFSVGLLTSTGSLGLLFPPSLPVIFYGVISHTPIDKLFIAGIVPGILLLLVVSLFGMQQGFRSSIQPVTFDWEEALSALWESKWEIALPFLALFCIFSGLTTIVETSAIVVCYAFITQCFIYRDIRIKTDLLPAIVKSATLVGGILIILSVAMGLTNYMVDAQIPLRAADWVRANIESPIVFLLILNLFLLIVGCLMDIFSAIMVVVPLIVPMGEVFNIHPLHLGIIFLANLELGYLTPPVGLNLFLSSFRFNRPLMKVYRDTVPFFILLLAVVLLITYVPSLTLFIAGR